ncbi:hypothetical protein HJC23_007057 [Cyclotella cryptica]|uniref:Guanylate cyclase domain-containing protein n=1 Tax=Cyclotella cryptica TaxID=29204 RepID=A0ABD3P9U0_9STRA|eukprot:CCRYP_016474-RA/>CCRYP_016474-RA protein AED:0.13 eAED:0.13 QI:343/1/1/1/1/1/3/216/830
MKAKHLECTSISDKEPRKALHEDVEKRHKSAGGVTRMLVNRILDHNSTVTFMSLVTVYALYGDDVRKLAFQPSADNFFLTLSAMAFAIFTLEISLLCWCRENYLPRPTLEAAKKVMRKWGMRHSLSSWFRELGKTLQVGSFYFWLDLISTISMVFEMPWMNYTEDIESAVDGSIAGKASVAGASAAQKLKVIRMIRLVRLAKLYKYISTKQRAKKVGPVESGERIGLDLVPAESHVGAEMSDRTTKKVIIGILVMLIGIPLLQADEVHYRNEFTLNMVFENRLLLSDDYSEASFEKWEFSESLLLNTTPCIGVTYRGFDDGLRNRAIIPVDRARPADVRKEAMNTITISALGGSKAMTTTFDDSQRIREEALLGILLTSFIIVLLGLGMISFTKDVRHLVIVPIEKMIQLVREISENPLGKDFSLIDDKHENDDMETTVLIRTISKIAGLMRVGFGEAGADIIGKNLNITTGGDTINLLGNGRKIQSIFGFCDVRQFTDTTECLQEEVMLFVNRIAHILHSIVVQCDGAANKNIGDAFLLTWKIPATSNGSANDLNYAADKALYSFVKTMIEMIRHEDFLCNFSPRALSELYERMPGYKCRIGCGLHFGWAIEGAIGSSKKIDASYISPHVNMSETLEASTKEYGVSILMSEPFYSLLSSEAVAGCRKVDVLNTGKSGQGAGLYTYDVDLSVRYVDTDEQKEQQEKGNPKKHSGFSLVRNKKNEVSAVNSNKLHDLGDLPVIRVINDFPGVWKTDVDVDRVRAHFTAQQRCQWETGIQAFIDGKWEVAKANFEDVLKQSENTDGPSKLMLGRMKEYNYSSPESWPGYWQS